MTRLCIVQHGKAYPKDVDPGRKLTEEGVKETEALGNFLRKAGVKIDKVIHSGKTRAKMTAEILGRYLEVSDIVESDGLKPLDDPMIWVERLKGIHEDLMIVGHMPHLSKLVSILLDSSREIVKIRNSGVLCLEDEEGRWVIKWYVTPDLIR